MKCSEGVLALSAGKEEEEKEEKNETVWMKSAGKRDIGMSNYILQCPSASNVLEEGKSNKLLIYLPVMKMLLKTDQPSSQERKGLELSGMLRHAACDDSSPSGIAFVLEGPHATPPQPAQHLFLVCV